MSKILNTIAAFSLVAGMSSGAMAKPEKAEHAYFRHYDEQSLNNTFLVKCQGEKVTDPRCQKGVEWLAENEPGTGNGTELGVKFEEMNCKQLVESFYANTEHDGVLISDRQYHTIHDYFINGHADSSCDDVSE